MSTARRPTALRWAAALVVCTSLGMPGQAAFQQQPIVPDVQTLGPHVGDRVPDFALVDQNGRSRTLMSLMGPKGLMLVFFRSADW